MPLKEHSPLALHSLHKFSDSEASGTCMDSPTFGPLAQDAGTAEHGEHSEVCQRRMSKVKVVFMTLACREKMKTSN